MGKISDVRGFSWINQSESTQLLKNEFKKAYDILSGMISPLNCTIFYGKKKKSWAELVSDKGVIKFQKFLFKTRSVILVPSNTPSNNIVSDNAEYQPHLKKKKHCIDWHNKNSVIDRRINRNGILYRQTRIFANFEAPSNHACLKGEIRERRRDAF